MTGTAAALAPAWLAAWCALSGIPMGAAALLLIHRLTGGDWGRDLAPVLRPAARAMPLLALLFLPLLLDLPSLYPWAAGAAVPPDVAALWLNGPGFTLRALAILALWSGLSWLATTPDLRPGAAAALLCLYAVTACMAGIDWLMSRDPAFHSTAFGAAFASGQVLTGLAWAAAAAGGALAGPVRQDLARLLFGVLPAFAYLWFMQALVTWSGNLPEKSAWFADRLAWPWQGVLLASVLAGLAAPLALLLTRRGRRSGPALRVAGALALAGMALLSLWQVRPELPAFGAVPVLLLLACAAAVAVAARRAGMRMPAARIAGGAG
ncbi:MAG: hypothetical protein RIB84_26510 [Sneathiellaceae bacterium]